MDSSWCADRATVLDPAVASSESPARPPPRFRSNCGAQPIHLHPQFFLPTRRQNKRMRRLARPRGRAPAGPPPRHAPAQRWNARMRRRCATCVVMRRGDAAWRGGKPQCWPVAPRGKARMARERARAGCPRVRQSYGLRPTRSHRGLIRDAEQPWLDLELRDALDSLGAVSIQHRIAMGPRGLYHRQRQPVAQPQRLQAFDDCTCPPRCLQITPRISHRRRLKCLCSYRCQ